LDDPTEVEYDRRASEWMARISPLNPSRFRLDLDHAALLVVDMQRYFLDEASSGRMPGADHVMRRVVDLADHFRSAGRPVIYTRHAHEPDGSDAGNFAWWWASLLKEGTLSAEIHPLVAPKEGDQVIRKVRYSAFHGTGLDGTLRGMGVTDVVVTGVMTNLCCETTARDAYNHDFRVKFVADATTTAAEEMHLATLLNLAYGFAEVCLAEDIIARRC
jgi:nicotinamidase-related amidase